MRVAALVSFVILCGVLSLGCTRYLAPEGLPVHPAMANAALKRANANQKPVIARAEIEVKTPLTSDALLANVVMRAPGDLRLELLTPTGDMLAIFVANKSEKRFFRRGEDHCIVHVDCGGDLRGILPLPIQVSDLVSILLGGGPRHMEGSENLGWDPYRGAVVFEESEGDRVHRIVYLDACSLKPTGAEWWKSGELELRSWNGEDGTLLFDVPEEGVEVSIRLPIVDDSTEVEDDAFEFECPRGVNLRRVRCTKNGNE